MMILRSIIFYLFMTLWTLFIAITCSIFLIKPNKYCFHIVSKKMDGFNWGIGGFGLGSISSHTYEFEVCEINHSTDYKIVTQWIDKN